MVEYTYNAWGNILKEKSNVNPSYATVQDFSPFRYRGYVYDTDTGLYYLQSRYYDPKTGRFINADDTAYIGDTGTVLSANIFAYCDNNAISCYDPSGCYNIECFNCYAYLCGIYNKWMHPGKGIVDVYGKNGYEMPYSYSVNDVQRWVIKDFNKQVRKISGKNSKIKKIEYRIAFRVLLFIGPLQPGKKTTHL